MRIRPKIGGAVYLLPNLLTTGNLFFGFFSIIKALHGQYQWAAGAILLAAIFDILDGRVARLTNGTSEFGVQYDSLCDLVSFGLAPAFLMYHFALRDLGRIGWIVCFIFLSCGALRLARFNVQSSIGKTNGDFTGLPIPMAAGAIACFIAFLVGVDDKPDPNFWLFQVVFDFFADDRFHKPLFLVMAPLFGGLMVSNVAYRSHKTINTRYIKPFRLLAVFSMALGLIAYWPAFAGFVLFFGYAMSGLVELVLGWKKPKDEDEIFAPLGDGDSVMEPPGSDGGAQS